MYKIILIFQAKLTGIVSTLVFTYSNLDFCRQQLRVLKDIYIYTSMDATILELKIYKVKQIQDTEQI